MKRKYEAPVVSFEDFELSTSIAAGCIFKTGHAEMVCAYTVGERNIFIDAVDACTTKTQDNGYDSFCYHVPTEAMKLFTS